jgi:FAD/FMN-containing dehydrogenase
MAGKWTNWVGNQSFKYASYAQPSSEKEVVKAVKKALEKKQNIRVMATGHSFTPIVETDGLLLDLEKISGIKAVDPYKQRAFVGSGTPISALGDPLWEKGLALRNQGDIDSQRIAGAISTGTHGSGTEFGSFSSILRSCRIVTGTGEVVEINEKTPDLLHAAQVSVGMLGVMVGMELQVTKKYKLREHIDHEPFSDVMRNFHERVKKNRNFSFFWFPSEESAALYNIELPPGEKATDTCHVKVFNEARESEQVSDVPKRRVDRSYRIYPMFYSPNFHELEYFIPLERAVDCINEMREYMLKNLPLSIFPLEIRSCGSEDGFLSSNYKRETLVVSVSGMPGVDYWPYLREVDRILGRYDARVHWGKLHFLTKEQLHDRYPKAEKFIKIRKQFDPKDVFLNDHLRPLFAH